VVKFLPRATTYFYLRSSNSQTDECLGGRGFVGMPSYRGKEDVAKNTVNLLLQRNWNVEASKGEGWSKEIGEAKARKQTEAPCRRKMCG